MSNARPSVRKDGEIEIAADTTVEERPFKAA